jgi:formylglycine-generating enzyme
MDGGEIDRAMSGCCIGISSSRVELGATFAGAVGRDSAKLDQAQAVELPGGNSTIGTRHPLFAADGEGPERRERVRSFGISPYAVTNEQFERFVASTGYRTEAEEIGWSAVFDPSDGLQSRPHRAPGSAPFWWTRVDGASWRAPEGEGTSFDGRERHPVVHISLRDADAYARWAGGRLPTEAEWEYAARGGLPSATYPWGERAPDDLSFMPCNIWQGRFPFENIAGDGYTGTAPVDSFEPNGFGLFNMAGNVWEWCSDRFRVRSLSKMAKARNAQATAQNERVIKGGSYLCHASYCHRYRIAARSAVPPDTATTHLGFRIVFDLDRPPMDAPRPPESPA